VLLVVLAIGAGALAVTSVGAWQRGRGDAATATAPTLAVPVSPAPAAPLYTIYLTDSAEQAARLEHELAAQTPATGEPLPGQVLALAAGTADERARARFVINMLEHETNGRGVYVVDARPAARVAHPGAGGSGCGVDVGAGEANLPAC
jgi:hypothetical protein